MATHSSFKVRLRRPATTTTDATASTTSNTVGDFVQPKTTTTDAPRKYQLLKTPTRPIPLDIAATAALPTAGKKNTTPTEDLGGGGSSSALLAANLNSSTNTTTSKFSSNGPLTATTTQYSLVQELFEMERKVKIIESNPGLFSKFRSLQLNVDDVEEEPEEEEPEAGNSGAQSNDENVQPSPEPDTRTPEPIQPSRISRNKIIRAFSANESVVEILPDHDEPAFVKAINNGILQLPNSHQKISTGAASKKSYTKEIAAHIASQAAAAGGVGAVSSTSKRGRGGQRVPTSSGKKKTLSSSKDRQLPWLKRYPAKGTPVGRILRPLNLESTLTSAAISGGLTSGSESGIVVSGSTSASTASRPVKSAKSLNSLAGNPTVDMDITSIDETAEFRPLQSARSMPAELEKSSKVSVKSSDPAALRAPSVVSKTGEASASKPSSSSMPPPPVPPPALKSLKALNVPAVPKMPSKDVSSAAAATSKLTTTSSTSSTKKTPAGPKTVTIKGRHYQILNKIGRGGSAVVYQVYDLERQTTLALKTVDLSKSDKSVVKGFREEISLLHSLRDCKRVVRMIDYEFRNGNKELYILMEKGDNDLARVIHSFQSERAASGSGGSLKNNNYDPVMVRFYWKEMVKVVNEIHLRNIVHSDLKPVNFIIVGGKLKLIDFGIANKIQSNKTSVFKESIIGTVDFMAPESFQKSHRREDGKSVVKFNQKADIWSLGVILFNLVYGHTPFGAWKDNWKKGMAIISEAIEYPPLEDALLLDVLKQCLNKDPTHRPTAATLLKHPYTTGDVQQLSSRTSSSESLHSQGSSSAGNSPPTKAAPPLRNLPTDLLSKMEHLTPTTLRNISKMVDAKLGAVTKK